MYVPSTKPEISSVVSPLLQLKVYGSAPPTGVILIVPFPSSQKSLVILTKLISKPDVSLIISSEIVTEQPVYTNTDIPTWTVTINWVNATFEMSEKTSWTSEFKFKVIDSQWLESDERTYILSRFDNG